MRKQFLFVAVVIAAISITSAEAGGHRGGYHSSSHVNGYCRDISTAHSTLQTKTSVLMFLLR